MHSRFVEAFHSVFAAYKDLVCTIMNVAPPRSLVIPEEMYVSNTFVMLIPAIIRSFRQAPDVAAWRFVRRRSVLRITRVDDVFVLTEEEGQEATVDTVAHLYGSEPAFGV